MCNVVNAYQLAVKKFKDLDFEDIELRTGTTIDREQKNIYISYFGRSHVVDQEGRVFTIDGEKVNYNDRTIILQYLVECSGLPPRGKWLSFLELPDGRHHYVPFQKDGTNPLARVFEKDTMGFEKAAAALGGTRIDLGDTGFKIPALPKLPLAVILWEGDEEFSARTNILFDSVAPTHLTTAALWVLGVELATKMIAFVDEEAAQQQAVDWLGKEDE